MSFKTFSNTPHYWVGDFSTDRNFVFKNSHCAVTVVGCYSTLEEAQNVCDDCNALAHHETEITTYDLRRR